MIQKADTIKHWATLGIAQPNSLTIPPVRFAIPLGFRKMPFLYDGKQLWQDDPCLPKAEPRDRCSASIANGLPLNAN